MDRFDLHGTTTSGHALGSVAGLESLRILAEEDLVANSAQQGRRFLERLKRRLAGHPLVRDIRGRGLLVGIEIGDSVDESARVRRMSRSVIGQWVALRLLERGFLCQPATGRWNVLRLEPPLTIREAEVDRAVEAIGKVLDALPRGMPALRQVMLRAGRQLARGFTF